MKLKERKDLCKNELDVINACLTIRT